MKDMKDLTGDKKRVADSEFAELDICIEEGPVEPDEIKKMIPQSIAGLSRKELVELCVNVFSRLGWNVKKNKKIICDPFILKSDIVLLLGEKEYGYVDVVTDFSKDSLIKEKKQVQLVIENVKPKLFILTNGMEYDVFWDGIFTQKCTIPPSVHSIRFCNRMEAYIDLFFPNIARGK